MLGKDRLILKEKRGTFGILREYWPQFLLAFLFPTLTVLAAFAVTGCYPFGDRTILTVDLYHQYCPFLVAFRNNTMLLMRIMRQVLLISSPCSLPRRPCRSSSDWLPVLEQASLPHLCSCSFLPTTTEGSTTLQWYSVPHTRSADGSSRSSGT